MSERGVEYMWKALIFLLYVHYLKVKMCIKILTTYMVVISVILTFVLEFLKNDLRKLKSKI